MTTAANTTVIRQWIADFVAETLRTDSLEGVVTRLDNAIIARIPELADRDMRRDLAASTRAHALEMLAGLNQEHMSYPVPEEAHAFARTIARRGHDLRVLLRIYHVGQEAVLDYMTEVINQRQLPQEIERAVLLRLFDRSIRWVGTSVEALTGTYTEERERGLRAALTRRSEIVHALLDGGELEIEEASARLGYRLSGRHLALVLWTDEDPAWASGAVVRVDGSAARPDGMPRPDGDTADMLERVVARCAGVFGGDGVLTVAAGASSLWAWIAVSDDTAPPTTADWPVEAPVRIAAGIPAAGLTGFRRGHREAVAARHVAERAQPNSVRVLHYPDVEVAYLAGADEDAMRALVERELGPLAEPGPQAARLRETLHAYLRANRSPDTAAKSLGVHKNTVRYRIQRIEELLGHSIDHRGARLEIALDCVAVYGV